MHTCVTGTQTGVPAPGGVAPTSVDTQDHTYVEVKGPMAAHMSSRDPQAPKTPGQHCRSTTHTLVVAAEAAGV